MGSSMIFCTTCSNRYHTQCIFTSLTERGLDACQVAAYETLLSNQAIQYQCLQDGLNALRLRAGWQCPDCKLCRQCGYPDDGWF